VSPLDETWNLGVVEFDDLLTSKALVGGELPHLLVIDTVAQNRLRESLAHADRGIAIEKLDDSAVTCLVDDVEVPVPAIDGHCLRALHDLVDRRAGVQHVLNPLFHEELRLVALAWVFRFEQCHLFDRKSRLVDAAFGELDAREVEGKRAVLCDPGDRWRVTLAGHEPLEAPSCLLHPVLVDNQETGAMAVGVEVATHDQNVLSL
jgi:hypothetical protein